MTLRAEFSLFALVSLFDSALLLQVFMLYFVKISKPLEPSINAVEQYYTDFFVLLYLRH